MDKSVSNNAINHSIDELEAVMVDNLPIIDIPVKHYFTDGMYTREVTLPKDTLATSKIHKTEHQFFILKGKCIVWVDGIEQIIEAPYIGITKAGTRRVVYVLEELVWVTSHANPNNENTEQIEERIIEKHDNPLLSIEIKERINLLK